MARDKLCLRTIACLFALFKRIQMKPLYVLLKSLRTLSMQLQYPSIHLGKEVFSKVGPLNYPSFLFRHEKNFNLRGILHCLFALFVQREQKCTANNSGSQHCFNLSVRIVKAKFKEKERDNDDALNTQRERHQFKEPFWAS